MTQVALKKTSVLRGERSQTAHFFIGVHSVMKFPLPDHTFPRVQLSRDDSAAIERVAQLVIEDTLQQYDEHVHFCKGVVDTNRWKMIKKKDGVAVFKERHASGGASNPADLTGRAAEMPRVLTVGKLQGDLDDVMYNLESHTTEMMRLKGAFKGNGVVDCKNLAILVKPTRTDPIRSVTLNWQVKGRPFLTRPFVRFRDSLYIESTGIAVSPTGERIGYQLNHSVEIPGIRDLSDMGIIRANLSFCGLYRQQEHGIVDMFITGFLDPLGNISPSLAVASMAELTVSASRNVLWGEMKKLTWMLSDIPPVQVERLTQAANGQCAVCEKGLSPVVVKKQCRLCSGRVCSSCRVHKELCLISSETGDVVRKSIVLCIRCMYTVATTSAVDVAAHEVVYEALYPSRAASVWSSSSLSGSSHSSPLSNTESSLGSDESDQRTFGRRKKSSWRC